MARCGPRLLPGLRRLALRPLTATALFGIGCCQTMAALDAQSPPVPSLASPSIGKHSKDILPEPPPLPPLPVSLAPTASGSSLVQVGYVTTEVPAEAAVKVVTVNLALVLQLAEQNNTRIATERERVRGAAIAAEVAAVTCVPNFLRNEDFKRYVADAKVWQQKIELARVTQEVVQDAGYTYIDLLAARQAEAVGRRLLGLEDKVLAKAEAIGKGGGAADLVESVKAAVSAQKQANAQLRQQGDAAAAKLGYLLNLPHTALVPADPILAPFDLVNPSQPTAGLVEQAATNGPGVAELLGLRSVIESALADASRGLGRLERLGCPGAGPRLAYVQSRLQQVDLALADARAKLALGAQEAHAAIGSGREQAALAAEHVRHADETYRLGNLRFQDMPAETAGRMMQTIEGLATAHGTQVRVLSDYDKAQVRLFLLLGNARGGGCPAPVAAPVLAPVPYGY